MCKTIMCETVDSRTLGRAGGSSNSSSSSGGDSGNSRSGGGGGVLESEPLVSKEEGAKKSSELWHIHGRHFDLSGFLRHHPGGSSILEAMRGAEDITPLFESYHALAHTAAIRQTLEKFEWTGKLVDDVAERETALVGGGEGKEPVRYRWDEGGFYAVLTGRVKRHFLEKHGQGGLDPRKASVNRFVKAPMTWYLKELVIVAIYVPLFFCMLGYDVVFCGGVSLPTWARAGAAFLAGAVLQSFSFCTLHDASHYGLLFKKPRAQEAISRVCNAWTLWHHGLWVMHHVYGHHSFTGDPERDPDLVHARPYFRKSLLAPKEQYDPFLVRWQRFLAPLFLMIFPGATLGQSQGYLRALRDGHLWHVSITEASERTLWYEYLTYVLAVGSHVLGGNIWVSFCYFVGISVAYHLCVAPDHDTFESSVVNSIETKREEEGRRRREAREAGRGHVGSPSSGSGGGSGGGDGGAGVSSSNIHSNLNHSSSSNIGGDSNSSVNVNHTSSSSSSNRSSIGSSSIDRGICESTSGRDACGGGDGGHELAGHVRERTGQEQAGGGSGSHGGCGDSGCSNSSSKSSKSSGRVSYSNSNSGGIAEEGRSASGQAETGARQEQEEEEYEGDDWGEVQVRHSGNFSNGNPLVTHAMGGINYQIEHHLFPSVSHMLYGEIAPIVRDACREFHVPYNSHSSLWSAYKSYLKHLMLCSDMGPGP